MSTFININYDDGLKSAYVKKHILYSLVWFFNLTILIVRLDTYFFNEYAFYRSYLNVLVPCSLIILDLLILIKQKWYYNLALIFYPLLILIWFIPKYILKSGKIYLLIYYLGSVFNFLKSYKRTAIHTTIIFFLVILLSITDSATPRIIAIIYFSYLYFKLFLNYALGSFNKKTQKSIEEVKTKTPSKTQSLAETIKNQKGDEKLTAEENLSKKIENIVLWNYFLEYVTENVNGRKGKRAFLIVCLFQYFLYFSLTLIFFTFLNYQIFKIAPSNYTFSTNVNLFDFAYYTLKNVTFSNLDYLKPQSGLARIIETCSFCILYLYFLIVTIASILSLNMSDYSKEMDKIVDMCKVENEKLTVLLKEDYNTDIVKARTEIETIKQAIVRLKKALERIL